MEFKAVKNTKTQKNTWYVNGKRVSHDKYEFKYTLCMVKGMSYNSSWVSTDKDYIRSGFCMN